MDTLNAMAHANDPGYAQQQADKIKSSAPHFHRWEEALAAFSGGLMPLTCAGNPMRFMDYATFLSSVMMDYARGSYPWPVYLRYIEMMRRDALLASIPATPPNTQAEAKRAVHTLSSTPDSRRSMLDSQTLQEIAMEWNGGGNNAMNVFGGEFIDKAVLAGLLRDPLAAPTASTTTPSPLSDPQPPRSQGGRNERRGSAPAPAQGGFSFPNDEWEKIKKMPETHKLFCIQFIKGRCPAAKCPRGRPHIGHEAIRKILAETPSGAAAESQ
jgi:hypothetical protein